MAKDIVISQIGGSLHLDDDDAKWLYSHVSDELKGKIDRLMNTQPLTLSEAIDYIFGTLSNKLRCNKWLCRLVDTNKEKYSHLMVNQIPTELFVIEMDRKGGELFRSQNNYDWENIEDWADE